MSDASFNGEVGAPAGQDCDQDCANVGRDATGMAVQPKVLSQPAVVQKLVKTFLDAVANDALSLLDGAAPDRAGRALRAAMVDDASYTRTAWHGREQLGEALLVCMNLPPDTNRAWAYDFVVVRALSQVRDAAVDLSRGIRGHSAAAELDAWARRLDALGLFVAAVFLGTHSLSHPGQTLQDQVLSLMADGAMANKTN